MKKIYMILAAMTLLTLSLNAQMTAKKNVAQTQQTAPTGKKVDMSLGVAKMASTPAINRAPSRADRGYVLLNDDIDGSKYSTGSDIDNNLSAPWSATYLRNQSGGVLYIRANGSMTFTVPSGYSNANFKFVFKTSTSYYSGYFTFTPSSGSANQVTTSAASTEYECELTGLSSGNTVTITGKYSSASYSPDFMYMYVYVDAGGSEGTETLTVCNGQYNAQVLPVLGYFHDESQHNQMIYPSSMLSAMAGKTIKSMTFYPTTGTFDANNDGTNETYNGINFYGGSVTFKLMNLSSGTSSFAEENPTLITGTMTAVKTLTPQQNTSATTWVINFDQDFTYTGGDLLIDVTNVAGTYGVTFFTVDVMQNNAGMYSYVYNGSTSSAGLDFLPKVTFTYEQSTEPQHDLAIALSAPATAGAGTTVDVTATVTNNGDFAENGYTVTVSDGTNIVNITAQEELGIGETTTFTVQFTTSANAGGSTVNYTATVACTDDAVTGNNTATASTSILNCPPPENVQATPGNNHNATMTWDAPIIPSTTATYIWNFEQQSQTSDWTYVDADGDGYNWDYNTYSTDADAVWTAHSGSSFMCSASYINNSSGGGTALTPNNWMISPEVPLGGTLTFWASGTDDGDYAAEKVGVFVKTGSYSSGVSGFNQVGSDITTEYGWNEYPIDLSQYSGTTGRIAIVHHNVTDMYWLKVDDITYQVTVPGEQPTSYNIYLDGVLIVNVPSTTFSYDFSNLADGEHTCAVSAVYSYGESVAVPATFTITSLPTPNAPTVNSTNGTTSTTITITPDPVTDGNLVYYVEYNGQQTQDLTFPRGATEYVVYVHAHTTATANYNESPEAVVPVTIPALPKTEAPVISYETVGDNVVITATGNGTVTLNIPGYPEATGTGSASITVPRHMEDYTVTATATAQEADHLVSEATTEQVPISGLINDGDWLQMDGSYTTGDQQLSFSRGNNPILFVDQFTAETHKNEHPDHYDYCLSEDVENDAKTSSTIPIPVHKTYSTLQGLYTKAEVDNDALNTPREITANAVNGTMAYDIKAGSEVYFYGLYRGALDANPVIDDSHRISMIQKDLNEAFFNENMTNDVEPKYSHIEAGDIKRVDKDFVTGNNSNTMSYVPVIWTYGDHTGRPAATGNNSYGSDIKRMKIGDVTARIEGTKSDGNSWGKWKVGETEYCVYTPVISITGIMPVDIPQGDGDYATYEPYMFRAWCTYDKAYDFGHDADGHLVGGDLIPAPFLLDSVLLEPNQKEYVLGGEWNGETRMPWAFGVEVGENPANITFLIRFYYKKVVTDAQQSSKLMGNRDGEGAEEYFAVQCEGDAQGIVTAINEILNGRIPIETTYVNAQGMTSNKPFDGLNIVVTRYSDGSTTTTKVVR